MSVKELISSVIEDELKATDSFLVGINANQSETDLTYFIDGIEGVSIDLCSQISRKVSRILDEKYTDEKPIRYEISSPGAEQPLVDIRQFHKHIGREIDIELKDKSLITGKLVDVQEQAIVLDIPISKHKTENKTFVFNNIEKSFVKISFKRKKK